MQIKNLQRNTSYAVTASIFSGDFEYRHFTHMESFETLDNENYIPNPVLNDTIKLVYSLLNGSETLLTTIKWDPTDGKLTHSIVRYYQFTHFTLGFRQKLQLLHPFVCDER